METPQGGRRDLISRQTPGKGGHKGFRVTSEFPTLRERLVFETQENTLALRVLVD